MFNQIRSRLSYANVVATIALFLSLGGGAYAAIKLPPNSVGPRQIKKNAVRSSDVKNSSLLAADFKAGQLPRGAQGHPGARGDAGPQGPKGDPCPPSDLLCRGPKGDTGATGSPGAPGKDGTNGTNGAPGPPGPTASSFASHNPVDFELRVTGFERHQVISLRDGENGKAGGDIVVPFSGRIFVSAALNIYGPDGSYVFCQPRIAPPGGAWQQMDAQPAYSRVTPALEGGVMLPVIGSAAVTPGTYYVYIVCASDASNVKFSQGTLLAWAVAS